MPMKKFLNDPANLTAEMLEGLALAYSDKVKVVNDRIVVRTHPKAQDKVALVCFGGTGHEPAMHGFVGEGMADAAVAGARRCAWPRRPASTSRKSSSRKTSPPASTPTPRTAAASAAASP